MSMADLPEIPVLRWTPMRKLAVIYAVRGGLVSMPDMLERYSITNEEFLRWCQLYDRHGPLGIRSNFIHNYRPRIPHTP